MTSLGNLNVEPPRRKILILLEFESVVELGDTRAIYSGLLPKLADLFDIGGESEAEEDPNSEERQEIDIILALNRKLKFQGPSMLKPVIEGVDSAHVDFRCAAKSPQKLLIARGSGQQLVSQAWLLADNMFIDCGCTSAYELVMLVMGAYYAWDLS